MAYEIEGRLLEVCTCNVLCPCWVGEDPDNKTCDTVIAWGIDKGTVDGVAVDGLIMAVSAHIPKNILSLDRHFQRFRCVLPHIGIQSLPLR